LTLKELNEPGASDSRCNPGYSEGRDEEDNCLKSAGASSLRDPFLEKHIAKKRVGGVSQGVGPEFKPQCCQKKKKNLEFCPYCFFNFWWHWGLSSSHPSSLN
jgi:hypothetical protein